MAKQGIRTAMAVGVCKASRSLLHALHRGGTTTPGKAAMAFDRSVLEAVSDGMQTIVVTGTNGKTTTCRMLEHALSSAGKATIANSSGANLLPGVVAEYAVNADWRGRPRKQYAVIECDEGAMKQVVPLVHPKVILVTNLFRDQLDRYGELTHTLEEIRVAVEMEPSSILCLNADCSLTSSLAEGLPNPVYYYGIDTPLTEQQSVELLDARYCLRCGAEYTYSYHTYAHLGGFSCPSCGYSRRHTRAGVTEIGRMGLDGSRFRIRLEQEQGPVMKDVQLALPAVYNIYNAAAAICAYTALGGSPDEVIGSLKSVKSSFGRLETFELDGVPLQMILVKNPAGCNQALSYLSGIREEHALAICLNDRTGDGHDISWIWDTDIERISCDPNVKKIYVSGDRAEDMQVRLKYGGADTEKIELVAGDKALIDRMRTSPVPVFILPNYTSMLSLRVALGDVTGKQAYWNM